MQAVANGVHGRPAKLMTIGEVSRRSGFTVRTLRFYERRGVVKPSARRPNGYRLYGDDDVQRLAFIRQAKALGLTLSGIRELVAATTGANGATRDRLLRMLRARITQTTDQIAMLTGLRTELQRRYRILARGALGDGARGYCTCLEQTARHG
jgi:DNA-binding transcriptional MerR regulator